mmetsp:Transcript_18632/g.39018  ORF Transcript_18632/g.39018 Transcript_18632/m.39018 type:complete len:232 (+) Transcript_18632:1033-1728(+)
MSPRGSLTTTETILALRVVASNIPKIPAFRFAGYPMRFSRGLSSTAAFSVLLLYMVSVSSVGCRTLSDRKYRWTCPFPVPANANLLSEERAQHKIASEVNNDSHDGAVVPLGSSLCSWTIFKPRSVAARTDIPDVLLSYFAVRSLTQDLPRTNTREGQSVPPPTACESHPKGAAVRRRSPALAPPVTRKSLAALSSMKFCSSPPRSGWCFRANFRYAFSISLVFCSLMTSC